MKPEEYEDFYKKLQMQGGQLLTTPRQYNTLHLFSESFPYVQDDSPKALFFPLTESGDLPNLNIQTLTDHLNDFMIKDYVKSDKGGQFPEFFNARSTSQQDFEKYMELFRSYRLDSLTGGICAKARIELKKYKGKTNEIRVFYFFGKPLSVQYELNPEVFHPVRLPDHLIMKYTSLPSPFYTVDFAETASGKFAVLETGDGQVSGLREFSDPASFYASLYDFYQSTD